MVINLETILSIENLNKQFGIVTEVNSISINVEKGQIYGLLGPNGSGKTTTLGIILGVIRQDSGIYRWFDGAPSAKSRRRIGTLIEQPNLYPWLTGKQNLKINSTTKNAFDKNFRCSKLTRIKILTQNLRKFKILIFLYCFTFRKYCLVG